VRDSGGAALTSFETTPLYWTNELNAGMKERLHPGTTLKTFDRPAIACMTPGLRAYGHWLLEILPRLWLARQALGDAAFAAHAVLIDSTTPDWAYGMMRDAAGVQDSQIVTYDRSRTLWHMPSLIVPGMVHGDFRFHPWAWRFYRSLPASGRKDLPRRIYVARAPEVALRDGANRRITDNAAEIEALLARRDIVAVYPERLSWEDQIAMFRRATLIVGEFGSGLHNAIFTGGRARVICLGFMNYVQSTIGALRNHKMAIVAPTYERLDDAGVTHLAFDVDAVEIALRSVMRARPVKAGAPAIEQPA
jgi:capsular polysaccharide biosynthesis protein